jgi:hypothetical protein
MDHNDVRHKLSDYIDGSLTDAEKKSVDEHISACHKCAEALLELQKTVEHIREIEEVEPPVWMTQKIMAKVRAEEEKKKQGLFQRLFFPLHIKLPLETIGVLFIAVTVYFVAQDVQETKQPFPEAPIETYSAESSHAEKGNAQEDTAAQSSGSLQRNKEVPQEPEYKALDMKPAYEKPKPPVPAPAPESMRPADEQRALKYEPSQGKSNEQAAPESTQDQAPAKNFSGRESASQAPAAAMAKKKAEGFASEEKRAATARAEISGKQILTLAVSDVDQATAQVEDTVKEYGGKILRKEPADGGLFLTVDIDPASRNRFMDRLKTLGELKHKDSREIHVEGTVIEIRIFKQVQPN